MSCVWAHHGRCHSADSPRGPCHSELWHISILLARAGTPVGACDDDGDHSAAATAADANTDARRAVQRTYTSRGAQPAIRMHELRSQLINLAPTSRLLGKEKLARDTTAGDALRVVLNFAGLWFCCIPGRAIACFELHNAPKPLWANRLAWVGL